MAAPSVSVHIVTWNSAQHLPTLFRSLKAQTRRPDKCIVVDNASADASVALVRELWPDATIVRNETNRGFCVAHNQAILLSESDFIIACNPDSVLEEHALERLLRSAEAHPHAGSVGGKILRAGTDPAVLDGAGLVVSRARKCQNRGEGETDSGQYDTGEQVFGVSAAFALYRRSALESVKIGAEYFDEDFFAYKDDIDLAWRLRLRGWHNWYDPSVRVWHVRTLRSSERVLKQEQRKERSFQNRLSYRNHILMLLKNDRYRDWFFPIPRVLAYEFVKFGYLVLHERSTLFAVLDIIRLAPSMLKKRAIARRHSAVFPVL